MESDFNKSIRMLEDALSPQRRSLFKPFTSTFPKELDASSTIELHELQKVLEQGDTSFFNKNVASILNKTKSSTSLVIPAVVPWKTAVDNLYMGFFEILQTHANEYNILEVISDFSRLCMDSIDVINSLKSKISAHSLEDEKWLENERNTWRLIYVLYQDRLTLQNGMELENIPQYFGTSEKLCVMNLFKRDNLIRESQLIIDWLECNAAEKDDEALHFSDRTFGWENTLHQLRSSGTIVFKSTKPIVTRLDPDAPNHQQLPLHDLDAEDEKQLCRLIFTEIRCGKLEEAQKLCIDSGHVWRAALYEGWRLFHDSNLVKDSQENDNMSVDQDVSSATGGDSIEDDDYNIIEGNANRDIWKEMAWSYCEDENLNVHEKAALGAYCGCLKAILSVCKNWDDGLWAYMKVMVDIRVESEIRDCVCREYTQMPEEYWEQRMSLNEIFNNLDKSQNSTISIEAQQRERIIQKYLILDDIPTLLEILVKWIEEDNLSTQFLRFIAHIVLFLEYSGYANVREHVEIILEGYIKRLAEMHETQLLAYYISKMNPEKQICLYASYLEKIIDNDERRQALFYGEESDLKMRLITVRVVENIRNQSEVLDEYGDLQHKITESDKTKVSALDWVLFYEDQKVEALKQSNALIFIFITAGKVDAAQLAFNKISTNTVQDILSEGEVPADVNQIIKEHLSYKAYLDAQEAFNLWFKQHNSKPLPPNTLPEDAQFTEKVAYQHRLSQHKAEVERWKLTTNHLSKTAKALFYNVLLFPEGGWLHGAKDADYLRSKCIPEVVTLLYVILFESGLYEECVQLADILADEKYCLYKAFSKEKLEEIILKLCESSVELLNAKKDPFGSEAPL